MDMLVDAKIIEDDSWKHVPNIQLKSLGVDKNNPMVDITIHSGKGG